MVLLILLFGGVVLPIIEKFLGGTAAGFHPDELKKKRKKPLG